MMRIGRMVLGPVETNVYLVTGEEEGKGLLIDPGDSAEEIISRTRELGMRPAAILLTHGHHDHILAAERVREHFQIPLLAMEAEKELLADPKQNLSSNHGAGVSVRADRWLRDGEELSLAGLAVRAVHTPGHTAGGACYYLPEQAVLFSGDTLFQMSVGRTDLPTGDMLTLLSSIREKLLVLPEDTKVYPGHGEPTTIGLEKAYNFFLH